MENTVRKKAWDNIVLEGRMIINKSTGEVVAPEVDYKKN